MPTVLVVDDEPSVCEIASAYLEREGFDVRVANNGLDGLQLARSIQPALIVLDLMLPKLGGLEVCRQLRAESRVPIIMLTARTEEVDRVVGLEIGADDYVLKPFSPRELVARVRAILRRANDELPEPTLRRGELRLDPNARLVTLGERPVELSTLEFDLLFTLAQHPGRVFSREELIERVWDHGFPGVDRVVDVHVSSLRRKLGEDADAPRFLITVRGVGYRFGETG